jgi:hypothetical protein
MPMDCLRLPSVKLAENFSRGENDSIEIREPGGVATADWAELSGGEAIF